MNLAGNKVILRTIEEQDREMLLNLIKDPEIIKITRGYSCTISCDYQKDWLASFSDSANSLHGIIADKESPKVSFGIIILSHIDRENGTAEIYIKLLKAVRKRGYGRDAINVFVSYAFRELGLKYIYCQILECNRVSRKLFEKCGFKQEETCERRGAKNGDCRNVYYYRIGPELQGTHFV